MYKVEHIGIAVKDLSVSVPLYEQLLNTDCYKKEAVETEGVQTAFYLTGASKIELIENIQFHRCLVLCALKRNSKLTPLKMRAISINIIGMYKIGNNNP